MKCPCSGCARKGRLTWEDTGGGGDVVIDGVRDLVHHHNGRVVLVRQLPERVGDLAQHLGPLDGVAGAVKALATVLGAELARHLDEIHLHLDAATP